MISLLLVLFLQDDASRKLNVELSADGALKIGGAAVEWKELEAAIKRRGLREATLRVDADVPFSSVTRLMDACKRAGLETLEFEAAEAAPTKFAGGSPSIRIKVRDGARGPEVILMEERPVTSLDELRQKLDKLEKQPIVIDAEYETRYGLVKEVAEACTKAGFKSLSFAAAGSTGSLRVLYVEHWPRWEYRFLKNALIRDPDLRVHILLTSSDENFPQDASPNLEPLRALPEKLDYDVVIVGDVPADKLPAEKIAAFVKGGGGLIVITGDALKELLPVTVEGESNEEASARLTEVGKKHLMLTGMALDDLPRMRWHRRTRAVEGATVLAQIGDDPLVVVKDRVVFLASDETYRWRWLEGDAPHYYPFWKRAITWAARK